MAQTKSLLEWEVELQKADALVFEPRRMAQISPNAWVAVAPDLKTSDRRPVIAVTVIEEEPESKTVVPSWIAVPVQVIGISIFGVLCLAAIPVMLCFGVLTLLAEGSGQIVNWLKGGTW